MITKQMLIDVGVSQKTIDLLDANPSAFEKVPLSVEYVRALQEQRANINRLPLRDMEFYEYGKKLDISEEIYKKFELLGLNNIDFIWSGFYKEQE